MRNDWPMRCVTSDAARAGPWRKRRSSGFTLLETLVVAVIVAMVAALLLPSMAAARLRARVVAVHCDLRNITLALDAYAMQHHDQLPPTRQSCGTNVLFQLPVELAVGRYLPHSPDRLQRAFLEDPFNRRQTYRYRAPGPVWQNGTLMDFPDSSWRPRAKIWVPDDVPKCRSKAGRYYANRKGEPRSPVAYAVWSVGPDPAGARFPRGPDGSVDESTFPLAGDYWLTSRHPKSGVLTHFRCRSGLTHTSP